MQVKTTNWGQTPFGSFLSSLAFCQKVKLIMQKCKKMKKKGVVPYTFLYISVLFRNFAGSKVNIVSLCIAQFINGGL